MRAPLLSGTVDLSAASASCLASVLVKRVGAGVGEAVEFFVTRSPRGNGCSALVDFGVVVRFCA